MFQDEIGLFCLQGGPVTGAVTNGHRDGSGRTSAADVEHAVANESRSRGRNLQSLASEQHTFRMRLWVLDIRCRDGNRRPNLGRVPCHKIEEFRSRFARYQSCPKTGPLASSERFKRLGKLRFPQNASSKAVVGEIRHLRSLRIGERAKRKRVKLLPERPADRRSDSLTRGNYAQKTKNRLLDPVDNVRHIVDEGAVDVKENCVKKAVRSLALHRLIVWQISDNANGQRPPDTYPLLFG